MTQATDKSKQYEYKAEMKQLLHLIIHSLYTHPEVFLRELISNASDALNKVRVRKLTDKDILDHDSALEIKIEIDSKKSTFSIEDSGVGMTEEELVRNIGTIARSGTLEFMKKIQEDGKPLDERLIGQFGVGFYSVFMVTDNVTVETRHANADSKGYRWKSSGESNFSIEEIDKKTRGTKISFELKEKYKEFAEEYRIKDVIGKYSNFVDFPIKLGKEQVNTVAALWRKSPKDVKQSELNELYKFTTNEIEDPLSHLHLSIEGAVVSFKSILFFPKTAPADLLRTYEKKGLHLYSNKILIQRDCKDLLPEYLSFVRGVVDTIDLPLNVSREVTQSSPLMTKIKEILVNKVLGELDQWSKKDIDRFKTFYKNFGPMLKMGLNSDFSHREKIIDLLRFETSNEKPGELISFKDYVSRMKVDQNEIYYSAGEHREAIERNPNLEYFKKNGIEVLFLTDPVDIFTIPSIPEFEKKKIKSIEQSDIELSAADKIEKPDNQFSQSLIGLFKKTLGDSVEDVVESKRLVDSPITLVKGKDALDSSMEKMMKAMNKDFQGSKRIMEVNMDHELIRNLSRMYIANENNPIIDKYIKHLHQGALFLEGDLNAQSLSEYVKRTSEIMQEATKSS